ncbi:MAG: 2'-deoxycytidine 5'-triphosphate deaminase [Proteobacteria bacterium]|nr:2'-deoxycytidine 5'-triphosphate deaminase [Pseudomonadota bacterium]
MSPDTKVDNSSEQSTGARQTGVWPAQQIRDACETGIIRARNPLDPAQIQPASLDLRLGETAYRVPASFLPGPAATVADKLEAFGAEAFSLEQGAVLCTGNVYIIPLQESLELRKRMSGLANPKSSTGRLDVFARVITDFGTEFDTIREGYRGPLWLEVAPRSFDVKLRTGSQLAQLRLKTGSPPSTSASVKRLDERAPIIAAEPGQADIKDGAIALSVDVVGDPDSGLVGYKARKASEYVDVDRVNYYDREVFWRPVYRPDAGGVVLKIDDFHILATKERIAVPSDHAADMVAYDTLVGEFRAHYAGFFDPGFGYVNEKRVGTPIVLEVRSHEVPFMVEDGQIVGRMEMERLCEPTDSPYGSGIGSSYQGQGLTLSKQFKS